mgnify:CR=1 FL=1
MKARDIQRIEYVTSKCEELKPAPCSFLDIGSSKGFLSSRMHDAGYEVTTIDILDDFCDDFKWEHHTMDIQKSHLDKKFDVICMMEVFEHLKHDADALANLLSMAHEDTLIFISVPNFGRSRNVFRKYTMKKIKNFVKPHMKIIEKTTYPNDIEIEPGSKMKMQFMVMGNILEPGT